MRRTVFAGLIVLLVSGRVLAERHDKDRDDHDDHGPTQIGYAIITPTSVNISGMVVFETFGLRRSGETPEAGLFPSDMTNQAMLFITTSGRLSRNMGIAIANPLGSSTDVTISLRDSDGTLLATRTITLTAFQQTARFVTELFANQASVPRDVTGTITISSSNPVAMVGLRFRGANFSTVPVTNLATPMPVPQVSPGIGGAAAVILPQFAAGGGWASEIVITNTGAAPITVRVDLFKQDGTALTTKLNGQSGSTFTNLNIPANGVLVLAPRDADGDDDF